MENLVLSVSKDEVFASSVYVDPTIAHLAALAACRRGPAGRGKHRADKQGEDDA